MMAYNSNSAFFLDGEGEGKSGRGTHSKHSHVYFWSWMVLTMNVDFIIPEIASIKIYIIYTPFYINIL